MPKVDITKMSDQEFNRRHDQLGNGMNWGFYFFLGGAAVAIASIIFPALPLLAGIGIAAGGATTSWTFTHFRKPYEDEWTRRRWLNTATPSIYSSDWDQEPEPLCPAAAPAFNPAAATVLENDMRPMAPLRLKKRVAEFLNS
ncbi:MAG: hypothetical protein ACAH83_10515 [Alphaproteobacteria bacterium]